MYSPSGLTAANILPYLLQISFFLKDIKSNKAPTFYFLFLPPSFLPTPYQGKHHLNLVGIIPMNVLVLSL